MLFPELSDPDSGHPAPPPLVHVESPRATDPVALSRGGRQVLTLAPGLLHTPRFCARPPWISGVIRTIWTNGVAGPGGTETFLAAGLPPQVLARAEALGRRLVREELGGTFWAASPPAAALRPGRVLVQGAAGLQTALAHGNAGDIVLVLPWPDRLLAAQAARLGCVVLQAEADPWPLLHGASAVHARWDDTLALLAGLAGVPVLAHAPAGPVGAASLLAARYADPFTGRPIECEAALDIVAEWRRVTRANRAVGALAGMSFWKRQRMAAFFHDGVRAPKHRGSAAGAIRAAAGRGVAVWSSRMPKGLLPQASASRTAILRVEDGFVRSFGLGSGFLPPGSVIADGSGIYYDPARPSDLETLLLQTRFDPALLARARSLMARLVREGVTKYGAGGQPFALPDTAGRTIVLVPGQVADDLSVRLGGAGVAGNEDLLARVRAANPNAFVIYKPHPDVDAGHRTGVVPEPALRRHADHVVRGVPMAAVIAAVDEVHTLTSLAGYEALLRGKRVVVHGQPFYAGWGLTHDLAPIVRRNRQLTLEELSAGVLLLYARYVDPVTELPCPAEVLLDRLATQTAWRETGLMRLRRLQGILRARFAR